MSRTVALESTKPRFCDGMDWEKRRNASDTEYQRMKGYKEEVFGMPSSGSEISWPKPLSKLSRGIGKEGKGAGTEAV